MRVTLGSGHACLLTTQRKVYCWGNNEWGQVDDSLQTVNVPVEIQGIGEVVHMSASAYHTCVVNTQNEVWCWGDNTSGELGSGAPLDNAPHPTPVQQVFPADVLPVRIATALSRSCALSSQGEAFCWGHDVFGCGSDPAELCVDGPVNCFRQPQLCATEVAEMAVGLTAVCFRTQSNNVSCAGDANLTALASFSDVREIAVSWRHACIRVGPDDDIYCWGENNDMYVLARGGVIAADYQIPMPIVFAP